MSILFFFFLSMSWLWRYILSINIVTFVVWGLDKWYAVKGIWRVRERDLLIMSVAGGWLGAYMGMSYFRHKTLKGSFLRKFWSIVACWLMVLGYLLFSFS